MAFERTPRIGATSGTKPGWEPDGYLWTVLRDVIREAGGEAVWLGARTFPHLDPAEMEETLNGLDGLLLAGGADLAPELGNYAGVPEEDLRSPDFATRYHIETDAERDAYEVPLARQALELDMPVFGICRGFQVFNVSIGGSLIPDLRTGLRHRAYSQLLSSAHLIRTVPGSRVEALEGGGYLPINSRHHQGFTAEMVAPGLEPTAFAPDNVVEAVEDPKRPWRFAVQWHPERPEERILFERDRCLFRNFVEECKRR